MAHQWKTLPAESARVCTVCGARQAWRYKHVWGRNVGKVWSPKVGRCKAKPLAEVLHEATAPTGSLLETARLLRDSVESIRWGLADPLPADSRNELDAAKIEGTP